MKWKAKSDFEYMKTKKEYYDRSPRVIYGGNTMYKDYQYEKEPKHIMNLDALEMVHPHDFIEDDDKEEECIIEIDRIDELDNL